jgi:hypothetical protein
MAHPYNHNQYTKETIPVVTYSPTDDNGVQTPLEISNLTSGNLTFTESVQLRSGIYSLGFNCTINTPAQPVTVKVRPYIDHAQARVGNALAISQLGSSASATAITVAATPTGIYSNAHVIYAGTGAFAGLQNTVPLIHGLQVTVSVTAASATDTGKVGWAIVAVPE